MIRVGLPEGMKNPEGVARVTETLRVKDALSADIIRHTARMHREYLRYLGDTDDLLGLVDDLKEDSEALGELLAEYDKAHENFLKAVNGRE